MCKNKERFIGILAVNKDRMWRYAICVASLFTLHQHVWSQQLLLPAEAKPFILKGYEVLDFASGDINADRVNDIILVLKNPVEDSVMDDRLPRPLLILTGKPGGSFSLVLRNDRAIMGRHDGGVFGDPWQGIEIINNGFSLSFYGGSSWRWSYQYHFTWKAVRKKWFLTKEESSSFHSGDMDATMKNVQILASELGEIPLEKFSTEFNYEESSWKVIAPKTFFYDNPRLGSKPRKGYLVKGNICTSTRELKNFVEANFENSNGTFTSGFLLKKDLLKVKR